MPLPPCSDYLKEAGLSDEAAKRVRDFTATSTKSFEEVFGVVGDAAKIVAAVNQRGRISSAKAKERLEKAVFSAVTAGRSAATGFLDLLEGSYRDEAGGRSVAHQIEGRQAQMVGALRLFLEELSPTALSEFSSGSMDNAILHAIVSPDTSDSPKAKALVALITRLSDQNRTELALKGVYSHALSGPLNVPWTVNSNSVIREFGDGVKTVANQTDYLATRDRFTEFVRESIHEDAFDEAEVHKYFGDIMLGRHDSTFNYYKDYDPDAETAFLTRLTTENGVKGLRFKSPEAAWKFHEKLSNESIAASLVNGLQQGARDVALADMLTDKPHAFMQQAIEEAVQSLAQAKPEAARALEKSRGKIMHALDRLTGQGLVPVDKRWSAAKQVMSNVFAMSRLRNLLIMAIPDRASIAQTAMHRSMPALQAWTNAIRPAFDDRSRRALMAQGAEARALTAAIQDHFSGGEPSIAKRTARYANKFFSFLGINWMDDVGQHAAQRSLHNQLGLVADLAYPDLPEGVRRELRRFDVSPKEWDAMRDTVYSVNEDGVVGPLDTRDELNRWITPDQLPGSSRVADLVPTEENVDPRSLAEAMSTLAGKVRAMSIAARDDSIFKQGAKERRLLNMGTRPGTPANTLIGTIMMFKGYGLMGITKAMRREYQKSGAASISAFLTSGAALNWHMTHLMASTLLLGALSIALKNAFEGKKLQRFVDDDGKVDGDTPKALIDAMLAGGFGGLYADYLLTQYDQSHRSFLRKAAGPALSEADNVVNMLSAWTQGKGNMGLDTVKTLKRNMPNFFYTKWATDYLLWNRVIDSIDGDALRRMRTFQQSRGIEYWADPTLLRDSP